MRRTLFLIAVLVHVAVLLGWAWSLEVSRAGAPVIRLDVQPVDPRDLLRGDYVRLRYKVSDIPVALFASPPTPGDHGGRVYVALAEKDGLHEAVAASTAREALVLGPGRRLLVGHLSHIDTRQRAARVDYGIERYYIPEGKGNPPRGGLQAEIALTADGRPFLLRLLEEGRPYPGG